MYINEILNAKLIASMLALTGATATLSVNMITLMVTIATLSVNMLTPTVKKDRKLEKLKE